MKNKQLGVFALIGAPFLFIDMLVSTYYPSFAVANTWFTGLTGVFYITGWMASLEGLRRLIDNGKRNFSWLIIRIVMSTLILANLSNIWQFSTHTKPLLFQILDMGWPVSNLLMLFVAGAVIKSRKLNGYQKWVPLAMGLWFPVCILMGRNDFALYAGGLYSTIAWSLFAITIIRAKPDPSILSDSPQSSHNQNFNQQFI